MASGLFVLGAGSQGMSWKSLGSEFLLGLWSNFHNFKAWFAFSS